MTDKDVIPPGLALLYKANQQKISELTAFLQYASASVKPTIDPVTPGKKE
ncbi:hypothetical protein C900_02979 [Fulvivirga imtechensis AK7]|uniref:Uncharacterized protein n=1 Tax=Fulvivirga imtechensis AK7 TaxID=1237149 RepID=L8JQN7_9BACT|nr:hypothetical protein C900_02979 [Fulvivirga imtechensis AK7]